MLFQYLYFFFIIPLKNCKSNFFTIHNFRSKYKSELSMRYNEYNNINFKNIMRKEIYKNPEFDDLLPVLFNIEKACIDINKLLRCVSINNLEGLHNNINIHGEDQKKIDNISNRIMKNALCSTGKIDLIASEEEDKVCSCSKIMDNFYYTQNYFAVFDPLDGSSNIDSGLPTGTIFGIYKKKYFNNILQKGSQLVAAGYCLYSASTQLVISFNYQNFVFMFDDIHNEFILIKNNIKIPESGSVYSFNYANEEEWSSDIKNFIKDSKNNSKKISGRYIGALVADIHNIIHNGGIFGYPGTSKNPNGKLRLLYEAIPLAYIIENAGGMATNGTHRILDILPKHIHQRTPLFIGSPNEILTLECYTKK